jgi:predicted nucleotidyltransferase
VSTKEQILISIKAQIQEVLPDANIILFGSRAGDSAHEESDWDILVIADKPQITKSIKQTIHDKVFPLSVAIGAFINLLLVTKKDWQENPSYYSLKKTITNNSRAL